MSRKATTATSLFARTVVDPNGCWLWTGAVSPPGYGWAALHGRTMRAHRLAYLLSVGDIPPGKFVLHKCDERRCVNPAHLFLGDQSSNMADMVSKGRQTHGEKVNTAKLTRQQAREIRKLRTKGWTLTALAKKYGVSHSAISSIVSGRNWKERADDAEVPR